jgi:hypothetical protein
MSSELLANSLKLRAIFYLLITDRNIMFFRRTPDVATGGIAAVDTSKIRIGKRREVIRASLAKNPSEDAKFG